MHKKINLGTRGSKLALVQANYVRQLIGKLYPDIEINIIIIKTTGDKILDRNLNEIGGKGLFIKEIEEHLLEGKIDIAVHSMKDIPAFYHTDLQIPVILERAEPHDAFLSLKYDNILDMPQNATIATSSPRRAAQALNVRPDLKLLPLRGNIQTRIEKLKSGAFDATFLALAGLKRCNIEEDFVSVIDTREMIPAVAQGALGIQMHKRDSNLAEMLQDLHHLSTYKAVTAERAFLAEYEGNCHTPIAAYAIHSDGVIKLEAMVAKMDGSVIYKESSQGDDASPDQIGKDLALKLKAIAGEDFLNE